MVRQMLMALLYGNIWENNGTSLAPPAVGSPYGGGTYPILMDAQQMLFKS